MKKMLTAIVAGMMLCGILTAPISAAENYQKGDVNMDGVVDVADAQLVQEAYVFIFSGKGCILTEEQTQLASITNRTTTDVITNQIIPINISDAQVILRYATDRITQLSVPDDIQSYYEQVIKKEMKKEY